MACSSPVPGVTVCGVGRNKRVLQRESIGERWCFTHRGKAEFIYTVVADVEPSYYGPSPSIRCGKCGQMDGDVGFGRERVWNEEE